MRSPARANSCAPPCLRATGRVLTDDVSDALGPKPIRARARMKAIGGDQGGVCDGARARETTVGLLLYPTLQRNIEASRLGAQVPAQRLGQRGKLAHGRQPRNDDQRCPE